MRGLRLILAAILAAEPACAAAITARAARAYAPAPSPALPALLGPAVSDGLSPPPALFDFAPPALRHDSQLPSLPAPEPALGGEAVPTPLQALPSATAAAAPAAESASDKAPHAAVGIAADLSSDAPAPAAAGAEAAREFLAELPPDGRATLPAEGARALGASLQSALEAGALPEAAPVQADPAARFEAEFREPARRLGVPEEKLPAFHAPTGPSSPLAIVLVHGLGETPAGLERLRSLLASMGHTVIAPLLDGHGRENEALEGVPFAAWDAAVERALLFAHGLGKEVVLGGFSMGGLLAYRAARRGLASGLALFSPGLSFGRPLDRMLKSRNERGERWTTDTPIAGNPYTNPFVPMTAYPALSAAMAAARAEIEEAAASGAALLAMPVLAAAPENDYFIDQELLRAFAAAAGAELVAYPRSMNLDHGGSVRPPEGWTPPFLAALDRFLARVRAGRPEPALVARPAARGIFLALERLLLKLLGLLQSWGLIEPFVRAAVFAPIFARFRRLDRAEKRDTVRRIAGSIAAQLWTLGHLPGRRAAESWEAMGERHMAMVRASAFSPRGPGKPSLWTEPAFVREHEALTGARFLPGNALKPLFDGPASFAERDRLIRGARSSVHLAAWALYDDATGWETARLLAERKAAGLDVRVMVDEITSLQKGHGGRVLAYLEAQGVPVLRARDPERPYDGFHQKALIIDGSEAAVAGGMNVGDPYSHRDPAGQKWRDTDVLYRGPAAAETGRHFARLWNAQIRARGLALPLMSEKLSGEAPALAGGAPVPTGSARAAFVAQNGGEPWVLLDYLKAISGASTQINIENAYLVTFPSLRAALLEALARGVSVNILTNSIASTDEPIVGAPILESLPELIRAGANVYLKRGDTLHSKFMTVDGLYATVGSFNLYHRSVRFEHELTLSALDAAYAGSLDEQFARDLAAAEPVADPDALERSIPRGLFHRLLRRYFIDQI